MRMCIYILRYVYIYVCRHADTNLRISTEKQIQLINYNEIYDCLSQGRSLPL